MTTALVKDQPWSLDRARAGLVDRAAAAEFVVGGQRVRVVPEPLLRRGGDGVMRQSIRLDIAGGPTSSDGPASDGPAPLVTVRLPGGDIDAEVLPGPHGVRALIPAASEPVAVTLDLALGEARGQVTFEQVPVREWSIHLVQHSHFDIGYTDPQGTVLRAQLAYLDSCLDLARASKGRPEAAEFRWTAEALYPFGLWMRSRPRAQVEEFFEYVRAGLIELTVLPFNLHMDTCSTDELHELVRLARDVRKEFGVELPVAMQTDVPGQPIGLPDMLAQHGVKYLTVAHNWAGRSVPQLNGGQHLPRLFRWRAPSGESVLVWMTDSPHGLAYMEGASVGFSSSYDEVEELLPAYLTALATNGYPYGPGAFSWHGPAVTDREPYPHDVLHMRVLGRYSDNAPSSLAHAEIVRRWNETWDFPKLRMSTNEEFFRAAEERLGDDIPTLTGDWGDWWVEGVGSAARPQAMNRRAQAQVTDAQTLAALARVAGDGLPDADERSRAVYEAISLFDEHTWGASDPWTHSDAGRESGEEQWHWKYAQALRARDGAEAFLDDAGAYLGAELAPSGDGDATYVVVNTTGAARSSVVDLFVRESRIPLDVPLVVRDERTGAILPSEDIAQTNPENRAAGRFLRACVPDVPAVGMVRLSVHRADDAAAVAGVPAEDDPADGAGSDAQVLENEHLRVEVDLRHACIASIVDKATGRELVDAGAVVGMNAYVYDRYTSAPGFNHQANKTATSEELELLGARTLARPAVLLERTASPVAQELTYEYAAAGAHWVRVTLRLPRGAARLEIDNRLSKPATMAKESAYFAFPFAMNAPRVRYEITGGLTGPDVPHLPGAPDHMRAVRDWVSFEDDGLAVAWATPDAPLVEPEVIALPYAPFPESTAPRQPGTVYSWVHNNIWDTNFPAEQAFETTFRYAIGVRAAGERISTAALAMRTAAELTHPLVGVLATGESASVAPAGRSGSGGETPAGRPGSATGASSEAPAEWSMVSLDDDRVRLVAVVGAGDDDEGRARYLVKLQSYAAEPVVTRLRCALPLASAASATYLGDATGDLEVRDRGTAVCLAPCGVAAVLLTASNAS